MNYTSNTTKYRGIFDIDEIRSTETDRVFYRLRDMEYPPLEHKTLAEAEERANKLIEEDPQVAGVVRINEYIYAIMANNDLLDMACNEKIGKITLKIDDIEVNLDGWMAQVINNFTDFLEETARELMM